MRGLALLLGILCIAGVLFGSFADAGDGYAKSAELCDVQGIEQAVCIVDVRCTPTDFEAATGFEVERRLIVPDVEHATDEPLSDHAREGSNLCPPSVGKWKSPVQVSCTGPLGIYLANDVQAAVHIGYG